MKLFRTDKSENAKCFRYNWCTACLLTVLVMFEACAQRPNYTSPKHYDLRKGEKYFVPESLTEISGISFYKQNPDSIYAIQDELGRFYYFKPGSKVAGYSIFSGEGDYEDVNIAGETVVVLKSNGTLYTFPFAGCREGRITDRVKRWKGLIPKGEYESLYADGETGEIFVLCKKCKNGDDINFVTGYTLKMDQDSVYVTGSFVINTESIEKRPDEKKKRPLRPSALARHPITGNWYLFASSNKLLVVLDPQWRILEHHYLDPTVFRQPEGLAFDKDGNMYVSNEGDDLSVANILRFNYHPATE